MKISDLPVKERPMNEFIQWFEGKYGPYPGAPNEPHADVLARIATAMAEWADVCGKRTRNTASKYIRSQKRLARARKIKAVALADIDQLRAEFVENAGNPHIGVNGLSLGCPTIQQLALVKEAKGVREKWLDIPEDERRKIVMSKTFL